MINERCDKCGEGTAFSYLAIILINCGHLYAVFSCFWKNFSRYSTSEFVSQINYETVNL